ncbi:cleavage and polyadenylation specificity factor subunit 1-like [Sycon ciliatum]|uniref:cleavage and polyadenylation specificity factor subunit 1-like n=1 Tax=Sycon ciliatum TaxID=27933 RepID=UPI0031F5FFC0
MYSLMRQPHRPTAIEHCISCKFVTSSEENLVVAGTTQLQVFAIREVEAADKKTKAKTRGSSSSSPSCGDKLELLFRCSLHGVVTELQSVQIGAGGKDALLIAFDDGKVSLVEYDPATHDLITLAILNAEQEMFRGGMFHPTLRPMLRVDPENRCAVLVVYDRYLIVCPFRQDEQLAGRSPTLPHYEVELQTLDSKLHNVLDIQFLHGYFEPTLFVLFEPTRTCPGRVAARRDTVSLIAVSLSLMERVHPVIWSFDSLPFDCFKALPVPKPVGGIVVFGVNTLLYLNQSVPAYGVSLNSLAETSSNFPLRQQEGVNMSLDSVQACFVSSDRFVMSLRGGEIYVVCIKADNMRMVRGFQFDHAAASVLTCCMCTVTEKYLFLGSRLGNSLLLRCTQKSKAETSSQLEPSAKRRNTTSDWLSSGLDDDDELEVYGSSLDADSSSTSYVFEVCDSLINVGPLSSTSLGEPSFLSYHNVDKYDLELVSCSGRGKNGSLSILQQTIRPQLVTTFELEGCKDMWTVLSGKADSNQAATSRSSTHDADTDRRHSFLILAREDHTMILRTGSEILELDQSGFDTNSPTVHAGNIGERNYILQVCPQGVRLLDGENEIQHVPLVASAPITRCSLASPYALLQCEDGTIHVLSLDESSAAPQISIKTPSLADSSPITSSCLYKDTGKLFNTDFLSMAAGIARERLRRRASSAATEVKKEIVPGVTPITSMTAEEEDELLYGGADDAGKPALTVPATMIKEEEDPDEAMLYNDGDSNAREKDSTQPNITYWCVICRQSGSLEILSFPNMNSVFSMRTFSNAPRCLVDGGATDGSASTAGDSSDAVSPILEVMIAGLGPNGTKPYLLARSAQDLQIYQAFPYPSSLPGERLNVRFTKVRHDIVLHDAKSTSAAGAASAASNSTGSESSDGTEPFTPLLRCFSNIGSHSGIFFCGPSPHWIFMTQRGALRCHSMMVDGHVTCFAAFDNVNCPQGFLYFNAKSELRIAVLPRNLVLDSDWPVRKIPLRCTPHFVGYLPEPKIYGVITSKTMQRKTAPHLTNDDAAVLAPLEEGERFVFPEMLTYSLQLYSPATWETVPNATVVFDEFESVVSMQVVRLQSEQSVTGLKSYLALCTCSEKGEEVTAKGMIKIYDIAEVVPEPGKPLTKYKLKTCYDKEMKGPVSAIGSVQGYMVGVVGQKVYVWSFMGGKDLLGVAFVDTHLFVHSIVSIKDFLLVSDIQKSVSLLRFDKENRSLYIVSRDCQHLEAVTSNYIVDNKKLGFVVSDMMNNLIVFGYQPEALESQGGRLLLRRADIHVGTRVSSLWRTAVRPAAVHGRKGLQLVVRRDKRHVTWFSGMDGSVGYVIPVAEKTYRRLLRLQDKLITFLPHYAGLHPKGFRLLRSARPALVNPHRNILDGDLLMNFVYACKTDQRELARSLGTTPNMILSDLVDVSYSSCVY